MQILVTVFIIASAVMELHRNRTIFKQNELLKEKIRNYEKYFQSQESRDDRVEGLLLEHLQDIERRLKKGRL